MYDVDELIDACKLSAKRQQLEPVLYDVDHPLVGSAMKPIATALKQMRNNRFKMERRCQKIRTRNSLPAPPLSCLFGVFCFVSDMFIISWVRISKSYAKGPTELALPSTLGDESKPN